MVLWFFLIDKNFKMKNEQMANFLQGESKDDSAGDSM
jgi:hypothetical protein